MTTQKEKIEYLAKAVMTLSEIGDGKTAFALNEIRLELKGQSELPDDLEEAAEEYGKRQGIELKPFAIKFFKVGAKWQKKQDLAEMAQSKSPLSVAYANKCFENGKQTMKEEMMKEAMEGEVIGYDDGTGKFITVLEDLPDDSPYKVHNKVKLIVIPEEK